jgi:hypothetical protein
MTPTTHSGPDDNVPTVSTRGAFQHLSCHHCTHHGDFIPEFCAGNDVLLVWKHGVHALGRLLNLKKWARHGQTQQLRFPVLPNWGTLLLVTRLNRLFLFVTWGYSLPYVLKRPHMAPETEGVL